MSYTSITIRFITAYSIKYQFSSQHLLKINVLQTQIAEIRNYFTAKL